MIVLYLATWKPLERAESTPQASFDCISIGTYMMIHLVVRFGQEM